MDEITFTVGKTDYVGGTKFYVRITDDDCLNISFDSKEIDIPTEAIPKLVQAFNILLGNI